MKDQVFYLLLALGMAGSADARPGEPPRLEQSRPNGIYGGELMSQREKQMYQAHLQALSDPQERKAFLEEHRQRMDARARGRGVTLFQPEGREGPAGIPPGTRAGPGLGPVREQGAPSPGEG